MKIGDQFPVALEIGAIISIVCLLFTLITAILIRRHINTDDDLLSIRNFLHIHLTVCLLIVELFYLVSVERFLAKQFCRIVSIGLHYFLLATFSWMFADGIELIIALKYSLKADRTRFCAYSLYAYGFPFLIVVLSLSLSNNVRTHRDQPCWLSSNDGFIWAFAIPLLLLISINFSFVIFYFFTSCRRNSNSIEFQRIRSSLRNQSFFSIFFGSTWFIGLFISQQPSKYSSIFAFINSAQGLFVFLFFCLTEKHVQQFYRYQCCSIRRKTPPEKLNYNTSSSGYGSSEINKQVFVPSTSEYLPNFSNQLTSFRLTKPVSLEHQQQLLRKSQLDEHQYYEIG